MTIYGWDTSDFDYDRGLRAAQIAAGAAEGIRFFTHKATEETASATFKHVHFGAQMSAARAAGIPFLGAYVVTRSGLPAATQAATAVAYVKESAPWLLLAPVGFRRFFWQVDTEIWPYDHVSPIAGALLAEELTAQTGITAVHYASRGMYANTIPGKGPLWNASYLQNPAVAFKTAYSLGGGDKHVGWTAYSGRTPVILQFGSKTTIGGQHVSDANAFRGTDADFANMLGEVKAPVPPVPVVHKFPLPAGHYYGVPVKGVTVVHWGRTATDRSNIRLIQARVGIARALRDGIYGPYTKGKVVTWQRLHGLTADGKVGPITWKRMAL